VTLDVCLDLQCFDNLLVQVGQVVGTEITIADEKQAQLSNHVMFVSNFWFLPCTDLDLGFDNRR
jgi:hypothetical protein